MHPGPEACPIGPGCEGMGHFQHLHQAAPSPLHRSFLKEAGSLRHCLPCLCVSSSVTITRAAGTYWGFSFILAQCWSQNRGIKS